MKKGLRLVIVGIVFAGLLAGISGCAISQDNARFTFRVTGPPGAEFTGSCTYTVKNLIGSDTKESEVEGTFTSTKTIYEYNIPATEISGKITNKTPDKPITVVLLKDGLEVRRIDELTEGEINLAWYPPITIDTKSMEAQGYKYENVEPPGNILETAYFTDAETNKIAGLIDKIGSAIKQQFEDQYQQLMTALVDPQYAVRSDPFWTKTEPYQQLLDLYRDKGDLILPLIFQHLDSGDALANYAAGSLLADMAVAKHADVLAKLRNEDLHGRYTEDGLYILPYSANTMRLAKELLAIL